MSATLAVVGMICKHCEQRVADALAGVDGAEDTTAGHEAKRAIIESDANTDALVVAVGDAGYDASA